MGLGPPVLELYRQLKILGAFDGVRDVMELGSQDFWCPQADLVRALCAAFGCSEPAPELLLTSNASQLPARLLYDALGLTYQCVDVDGRAGSLMLDMNFDGAPDEHVGRYDLVTNHGTSEHLLNQYNVFKLMHDFARPGGLMVHAVPFTVHLEHGFFNYQPNFFEAMARYNSYEILGLWVGPDWQLPSFVPWQPALLDFLRLSAKTTHLLVVALRKLYASEFRVPFQNHYEGAAPAAALSRYAVTVDGETVSGERIKYLGRSDALAKEYLAEIRDLRASLNRGQRRIAALQRVLAGSATPESQSVNDALGELEKIRTQLSAAALVASPGSQAATQEFTYEGHGQTASVIPQDRSLATREHGAAIMRAALKPAQGSATLQFRALLNCYVSEPNSVVLAVFQDGKAEPVVLLAEPLMPEEAHLIDKEVLAVVDSTSVPAAFEIRVGLAYQRGVLFLNRGPGADNAGSLTSRFRVRWMADDSHAFGDSSVSNDRITADEARAEYLALLAQRDGMIAEYQRGLAERDGRIAEQDRLLAERDRRIAEQDRLLAERDGRIAEHERLLVERDGRIAEHERLLAERDARIAERDHLIAEQHGTIAGQTRLLAEREAILAAMKRSRSWRLTAPLRGATNWLRRERG